MLTIIDYGAGNIASVQKAFTHIGCDVQLSSDPAVLAATPIAVLPGVGSFGDAMRNLRAKGLEQPIQEFIASGRPLLGICLGLQLLFESSAESPGVAGLGVLKGKILRIPEGQGLKIPHMGWNSLNITGGNLFQRVQAQPYVYFVHSYYLKAEEDIVTATTEYGVQIDAAVEKGNLSACQFHPEKSGSTGLAMLKCFAERGRKLCMPNG